MRDQSFRQAAPVQRAGQRILDGQNPQLVDEAAQRANPTSQDAKSICIA